MSLLSTYARRSLALTRMNLASPVAAVLPHWSRSFSNSPQSFKKIDVIKHAPGWDPTKATESEADVKADRDPLPRDIKELQEETIKIVYEEFPDVDGQPVRRATEELNKKLEKFGDKIGKDISVDAEKGEEVVEDLAHQAQKAGAKLGKVTGTVKGKVDRAEDIVTEEMTEFVQSVKKKINNNNNNNK
ncbi:hypothetical protein BGX27_000133 [Mortierella sp. AM989]|nr:hypothetical protein BGX27_000133 [Mortierella sp. AM989]